MKGPGEKGRSGSGAAFFIVPSLFQQIHAQCLMPDESCSVETSIDFV